MKVKLLQNNETITIKAGPEAEAVKVNVGSAPHRVKARLITGTGVASIKAVESAEAVKMAMDVAPPKLDIYDGVYDVTPMPNTALELQTEHKLLERNVVVAQIPYYETHNESGITVYIGE